MPFPQDEIEIRSPQEFIPFLALLKQVLRDGSLRQYKPADVLLAMDDIRTLTEEGPWPDYMEAYFEDVQSRTRYRLCVETYHGSGGSWERL